MGVSNRPAVKVVESGGFFFGTERSSGGVGVLAIFHAAALINFILRHFVCAFRSGNLRRRFQRCRRAFARPPLLLFLFLCLFFGADLPPPIRVAAASFACASIRAIRPSSTLYPTLIGSPISSDVVESDLFRRRVSILAHFLKILPDFLPSIFLLVPITIFWFEVKVALLMFFCLSQFWLLLAVPCSVLHI